MNKLFLALLLSPPHVSALTLPSVERLQQGCGFDGAARCATAAPVLAIGGTTEEYIRKEIDRSSGLSGSLLEEAREGEAQAIQRMMDESPTLTRMMKGSERKRSWNEYYQERIVDAAVASWGSNLKAGYLKGTAAAYATYKTAPPVVAEVAGGVLWLGGIVYGLGLALAAAAVTGHF